MIKANTQNSQTLQKNNCKNKIDNNTPINMSSTKQHFIKQSFS